MNTQRASRLHSRSPHRSPSRVGPPLWTLGLLTKFLVPPLITFMGFLGIWLYVSYIVLEPSRRFLLPPPQDVLSVGFFNPSNLAELVGGLASTTVVALVGLAVAAIAGLLLAILMSQ